MSLTARPVTHHRSCLAFQLLDLFVEGDHLGFGLQLEFSEAGVSCILLTLEQEQTQYTEQPAGNITHTPTLTKTAVSRTRPYGQISFALRFPLMRFRNISIKTAGSRCAHTNPNTETHRDVFLGPSFRKVFFRVAKMPDPCGRSAETHKWQ